MRPQKRTHARPRTRTTIFTTFRFAFCSEITYAKGSYLNYRNTIVTKCKRKTTRLEVLASKRTSTGLARFSCPFGSIEDPRLLLPRPCFGLHQQLLGVPVLRALRTFSHFNCQSPAAAFIIPYILSVLSFLSVPIANLNITPASIRGGLLCIVYAGHRPGQMREFWTLLCAQAPPQIPLD